jgi:hypothetical protein
MLRAQPEPVQQQLAADLEAVMNGSPKGLS